MRDTSWKIGFIVLGIVIALCLCGFVFVQVQTNSAISLEQQVESSQSDINVQEKRRADLIPNLVECVKSYSEYEYNTLKEVVAERGSDSDEAVKYVNAVAEAYPDLKADTTYQNLMNELAVTENLIARYRTTYNNQIRDYTYYVHSFPANISLSMSGYQVKTYQYLEYENASVDAPVVNFN